MILPYIGGNLTSLFGAVPQEITKKTAHDMADVGGDSIKDIAVDRTPVDTGKLRAAWERRPARADVQDGYPAWTSEVRNDTDYAVYVENGTGMWGPNHAPYIIRPKMPGGMLRWVGKDGRVHFARSVMHPGSPGHYMLATGLNVTAGLVEEGSIFDPVLRGWVAGVEAAAVKGGAA